MGENKKDASTAVRKIQIRNETEQLNIKSKLW